LYGCKTWSVMLKDGYNSVVLRRPFEF